MGHISYFSGLSNYSLQAGNWHPSPSMYVLLLDPEPSGMGGSLDPTDLGSGLLPRPGCPPPPHPTPPSTPQPFAQSPGSFPPGPPSSSWVSLPQPFTQFPPPRHRSFPTGAAGPTPKGAAFSPWALSFPNGRTFFPTAGANQGDNRTLAPGHMVRTFSSHLMRTPDHSGDDTGTTSWPQV